MKKPLVLFCFVILFISAYSQEQYLEGHFTNRTGNKTSAHFLLRKWNTIPDYFEYQAKADEKIQKIESDQISEIEVYHTIKYIRSSVYIDPVYIEKDNTLPKFETNSVLLQQLTEGSGKLFMIPSVKGDKFFYSVDNGRIEYLMFLKKQDNLHSTSSGKNKNDYTFRSQLINALSGAQLNINYFKDLNYTSKDLIDLFKSFNQRVSETHQEYEICIRKQSNFRVKAKGGANFNKMQLPAGFISQYAKEVKGMGFQLGCDMEVLLGKKNHWAICSEPMFVAFDGWFPFGEGETSSTIRSDIDYFVLQIPVGLRNYIVVRPNWSGYIQVGMGYEIPLNAKLSTKLEDGPQLKSYNIKGAASIFSSFGVNYRRFGLEYRYEFEKNLMKMTGFRVDFNRSMLSLAFRFN